MRMTFRQSFTCIGLETRDQIRDIYNRVPVA